MHPALARTCGAASALLMLALPAWAAAAPVTPPPAAAAETVAPAAPDASASAATTGEVAVAPATAASAPMGPLDDRVQDLKSEVIALNRDLLVLEEELLYPAGTQVALFVSMDVGKLFELESVQIKLDDKLVATHLYTPLEVQALHRGGMQRVYMGNLRTGKHRITAFFTGQGPHDRDYKRGTTLEFDKGTDPRYIELRIEDAQAKLQPEFEVKVWQ